MSDLIAVGYQDEASAGAAADAARRPSLAKDGEQELQAARLGRAAA